MMLNDLLGFIESAPKEDTVDIAAEAIDRVVSCGRHHEMLVLLRLEYPSSFYELQELIMDM